MRELKFRFYDYKINQSMIYQGDTESKEIIFYKWETTPKCSPIMQYTGKKDSNNKEIYEGDILWCESVGVTGTEKRVVCWDSYQAKFKSVPLSTYHANAGNGGWTGYDLYRTKSEVLGNIYENPELLQ